MGRIYTEGGSHPTNWDSFRYFGPTGARFDHQPLGRSPHSRRVHPSRGISYVAPALVDARGEVMPALKTCLVECCRDVGVIELRRDDPFFALFSVTRPVRLLDLADSGWLGSARGNAAISSGRRSRAREWARAVYSTYDGLDGVIYTTSGLPSARSVALWERAEDAMPPSPRLRMPLRDPGLRNTIERFAGELSLDLVP